MTSLQTITARDGATLIPFSDSEMSRLIRLSEGRAVSARFGTGGAALIAEEAVWAVPLLAQWRGLLFTDGGGI